MRLCRPLLDKNDKSFGFLFYPHRFVFQLSPIESKEIEIAKLIHLFDDGEERKEISTETAIDKKEVYLSILDVNISIMEPPYIQSIKYIVGKKKKKQ